MPLLMFDCFHLVFLTCSSSTFKDPERASLRDSGHGDSDQADSDQDTNKGSCCDMSAKEALKMKATGLKPQPLEQGESFNIRNFIIIQRLSCFVFLCTFSQSFFLLLTRCWTFLLFLACLLLYSVSTVSIWRIPQMQYILVSHGFILIGRGVLD